MYLFVPFIVCRDREEVTAPKNDQRIGQLKHNDNKKNKCNIEQFWESQ